MKGFLLILLAGFVAALISVIICDIYNIPKHQGQVLTKVAFGGVLGAMWLAGTIREQIRNSKEQAQEEAAQRQREEQAEARRQEQLEKARKIRERETRRRQEEKARMQREAKRLCFIIRPGSSQEGPYEQQVIKQKFIYCNLPPDTLIWHQNMESWARLDEYFGNIAVKPPAPPIPPAPKLYYIIRPGGSQEGPYNEQLIFDSYHNGKLSRDALIWCDGMDGWQPLHRIVMFDDVPPPPPA